MKRRTPNLRQPGEKAKDTMNQYGIYVKQPSKISDVFTRKPYESVKK
jgi:hypothetical protein